MFLTEFLFILVLSFFLAALFAYPLGRPGPWGGFGWFFVVLFLGTWAVAAWVEPMGPLAWGVAWVPIVVGALVVALLVAAAPPRPARTQREENRAEAEAAGALGLFFWLLLLGLLFLIGLSYVWV